MAAAGLPGWRAKKVLLLVASYFFYAAWNPPYVLILLASTLIDWWLARLIGRTENPTRRKLLLLGSLACNLGLLGYFKYANFVLENFQAWSAVFGLHFQPLTSNVVLPIGISFYTFASLSYTVDVYRREIRSDWTFADYALFVSFFPHLVAGPIVRASILLPQIEKPVLPTFNQAGWGFSLFIFGLFSKVVLADSLFRPWVDVLYAKSAHPGLVEAWIGIFSFSGQIFCDFNGYSLCAIGLALALGFHFPDNFRYPYGASSFSDFWRRWHISLSSWLRDYLYIPMGGNRHGPVRTYFSLFATMLIGGLWHGASWSFVVWGGLHGLYLAAERSFRHVNLRPLVSENFRRLMIFLVITLTWIPFRASSPQQIFTVLHALVDPADITLIDSGRLLAIIAVGVMVAWHMSMGNSRIESVFARIGSVGQITVLSLALVGLFFCSGGNNTNAFIYFQF